MSQGVDSEFHGETGSVKIYSKYSGELLYETIIPVGENDFKIYQSIDQAFRKAEKAASHYTKCRIKKSVINFVEEID